MTEAEARAEINKSGWTYSRDQHLHDLTGLSMSRPEVDLWAQLGRTELIISVLQVEMVKARTRKHWERAAKLGKALRVEQSRRLTQKQQAELFARKPRVRA
jgi:hypothetical protein